MLKKGICMRFVAPEHDQLSNVTLQQPNRCRSRRAARSQDDGALSLAVKRMVFVGGQRLHQTAYIRIVAYETPVAGDNGVDRTHSGCQWVAAVDVFQRSRLIGYCHVRAQYL